MNAKLTSILEDHMVSGLIYIYDYDVITEEEDYTTYATYLTDGRKFFVRVDDNGDTYIDED